MGSQRRINELLVHIHTWNGASQDDDHFPNEASKQTTQETECTQTKQASGTIVSMINKRVP